MTRRTLGSKDSNERMSFSVAWVGEQIQSDDRRHDAFWLFKFSCLPCTFKDKSEKCRRIWDWENAILQCNFVHFLWIGFQCLKIYPSGARSSLWYLKSSKSSGAYTSYSFFVDFRNGWRYRAGGGAALPSASYANISISGTKSLW